MCKLVKLIHILFNVFCKSQSFATNTFKLFTSEYIHVAKRCLSDVNMFSAVFTSLSFSSFFCFDKNNRDLTVKAVAFLQPSLQYDPKQWAVRKGQHMSQRLLRSPTRTPCKRLMTSR